MSSFTTPLFFASGTFTIKGLFTARSKKWYVHQLWMVVNTRINRCRINLNDFVNQNKIRPKAKKTHLFQTVYFSTDTVT